MSKSGDISQNIYLYIRRNEVSSLNAYQGLQLFQGYGGVAARADIMQVQQHMMIRQVLQRNYQPIFLEEAAASIIYKKEVEKPLALKPNHEEELDIEFKKFKEQQQTQKNIYKTVENASDTQVNKNDIRSISDTAINQITNKVYNQIVKKLKMEQLKRGN